MAIRCFSFNLGLLHFVNCVYPLHVHTSLHFSFRLTLIVFTAYFVLIWLETNRRRRRRQKDWSPKRCYLFSQQVLSNYISCHQYFLWWWMLYIWYWRQFCDYCSSPEDFQSYFSWSVDWNNESFWQRQFSRRVGFKVVHSNTFEQSSSRNTFGQSQTITMLRRSDHDQSAKCSDDCWCSDRPFHFARAE